MPANPGDQPGSELKLRVITHRDATVVVCAGWLTRDITAQFKSNVKRLLPTAKRIVLDLGGITYMDSSGLGAVVSVYVSAKTHGSSLRVANLNQHVRRLLSITRLLSVLGDTSPYPLESN
jgi:anti-sigma B factor antagonist